MPFYSYLKLLLGLLIISTISSCQLIGKSQKGLSAEDPIVLDTMDLKFSLEKPLPYRPADQRLIDVIHLELDLSFGMQKEEVYGKATLQIASYAEPQEVLTLDARGFELEKMEIVQGDSSYNPKYTYDQQKIRIYLAYPLKLKDTLEVSISYIARPTLLEKGNGGAITSSQGLYFINSNGNQEGVPQQIWSQGETEYNSGWFPSVDKPNEKFSQEIFLTVDSSFVSLSNGKLMYSSDNGDGTRTDYWKQDKEHSNYLVMIAVGDFAIVKDHWRDLDVWYFVDHEFEGLANEIFGNTPEMLEFYSELLHYDYPWDKYHQIVVKDFVSGAMENTGAVIHGDFVQQTPREMLDGTHEDVIAHELFHHWFGDLITAESWAQITMNEGFATYGEYLWQVRKYGIDEASYHLNLDLEAYLSEASVSPKSLIRYHYQEADDLFDRHSYQKGGRVVHMLRKEVGDDLFFQGLNHYLVQNEFKSVEDDHLRLAMEEVSGMDLKWFFDQWYYREGHPVVEVDYSIDSASNSLEVRVSQKQEEAFKFHVNCSIGIDDSILQRRLCVDQKDDTLFIDLEAFPSWYALDIEGDMLWQVKENKPYLAWENQLKNSRLSSGKVMAMKAINIMPDRDNEHYQKVLLSLLENREFWLTKAIAGASLLGVDGLDTNAAMLALESLILTDKKSDVRSLALDVIDSLTAQDVNYSQPFVDALSDSSYLVLRSALSILMNRNACEAIKHIERFTQEENKELLLWSSRIHAKCGDQTSLKFFEENAMEFDGVDAYMFNNDFAQFASKCDNEKVYDSLVKHLGKAALNESSWWSRISAVQGLEMAKAYYSSQIEIFEAKPEVSSDETERLAVLRNKRVSLSALIEESKEFKEDED